MEYTLNLSLFSPISLEESYEISGGVSWGDIADAALAVSGAAALIGTVCPPANAVALVCASFYVGYKVGKGLTS